MGIEDRGHGGEVWWVGVTVRMDPYPFSFTHDSHAALRQVLKGERHDLTLDHAMTSSFLFPLPCLDSLFLGLETRSRSADLYL